MVERNVIPSEIEKKSFEILTEILGDKKLDETNAPIIKRCIHTSADFEYADSLHFSDNVVNIVKEAIKNGADIITDTQMVKAGINKKALSRFGTNVHCFIADEDVADEAKKRQITRSMVSMEKAAKLNKSLIFAIGNAPTALMSIMELVSDKKLSPTMIIGVPVGFVNVVESKELIIDSDIPCIVSRGRKGGSNIAAAIVNAILYSIE